MKKLHILIPSLIATTTMPFIGLVGCKNGQDKPTTTHTITFSGGDHGSIEEGKETIVVEGDETKFGDIEKPQVIADEAHGWFFDHWDYDDSYIIKDDVTVTAIYSNISEYMIDMDQIESIISLEGVVYARVDAEEQSILYDEEESTEIEERKYEFSPNIFYGLYHYTLISPDQPLEDFAEDYVYHSQNQYWKKYRSKDNPEWTEAEANPEEFLMPAQVIGQSLIQSYQQLTSAGETLSFNIGKKCYGGSWVQEFVEDIVLTNEIEFYFKHNKIIGFKLHRLRRIGETVDMDDRLEMSIAYEEIDPEIPN